MRSVGFNVTCTREWWFPSVIGLTNAPSMIHDSQCHHRQIYLIKVRQSFVEQLFVRQRRVASRDGSGSGWRWPDGVLLHGRDLFQRVLQSVGIDGALGYGMAATGAGGGVARRSGATREGAGRAR